MRLRIALSLLHLALLGGGCALPRPWGEGVELQTNLLAGYRVLEHATLDGHAIAGLELVTRERERGWGYELGGTYGTEEPSGPEEVEAEVEEFYLGLRRFWIEEGRSVRPYMGFGGSWVRVENDLSPSSLSFDQTSLGAYLRGGALWSLGVLDFDRTEVFVGVDGRGLIGDELNSAELALVLGFGR